MVQGAVNPDEFYVYKPALRAGKKRRCCAADLGGKAIKMVYARRGLRRARRRPWMCPRRSARASP